MERSETADRALLAACAVVWLAVIGVSVAAIVALVHLGSGRASEPAPDSSTPWGLYVVIGVSAAVILGSIPLLLRARRAAQHEPPPRRAPAPAPRQPAGAEASTEKLRVFGSVTEPPERRPPPRSPSAGGMSPEMVDRIWLRFAAAMATAIGAATLAVATATYFMGVKNDSAAWAALTIAGLVTVAMPIIPWRQLRLLRAQI
ncbi:MAG: DUF2561 family protein [Mycobacteriaceae bacterium]|nr:DUF2561 family protein [Mycobacteriaceae bacterium]MBV9513573.1 DUF2561 family protein [Mycobacteriaceae bacterium]